METLIIVPARLRSTRLPEKLLLRESGKYLLEHVYERACGAKRASRVAIATDSPRIQAAAESFGAEVVMTREDHLSGTDRVAEAARVLAIRYGEPELVVNVQGDEPELPPEQVDRLIEVMAGCEDPMGTLAETCSAEEAQPPQVVKVVLNQAGQALYFSRAVIPHGGEDFLRHVGIYAYRPEFLQRFCQFEPVPLEGTERLEQLRALHYGHAIRVALVPSSGARGIDTREDYERFLGRVLDSR